MNQSSPEFGIRLKGLREARRVSQSKLAERADFEHSYVSRLESGARMPTRDAVERLARAMGLSQGEQDALLAAAGFLPRDVASLLSDEPAIGEVLDLLQNDAVPPEYRDNMRQGWRMWAEEAGFAVRLRPNGTRTGVAA